MISGLPGDKNISENGVTSWMNIHKNKGYMILCDDELIIHDKTVDTETCKDVS